MCETPEYDPPPPPLRTSNPTTRPTIPIATLAMITRIVKLYAKDILALAGPEIVIRYCPEFEEEASRAVLLCQEPRE